MFLSAKSLQPKIESDGIVFGGEKYFIRIWKPDSTVDYKILRVNPDMASIEKMPMMQPKEWKLIPHLDNLQRFKKYGY